MFRASAKTTTTLAAAGAMALLGSFSATAQQVALTPQQCRDAQVIGNAIMARYAISPQLAESFRNFRTSGCDLNTDWKLMTPVDETAFGEFRVRLIALRTADAGRPEVLARK